MSKKSNIKTAYSFDIPDDFKEKFYDVELYESIRDNKKIYASTTFARAVPSFRDGLIEAYSRSLYEWISNQVRYNGKTVKTSINKEKLEIICDDINTNGIEAFLEKKRQKKIKARLGKSGFRNGKRQYNI